MLPVHFSVMNKSDLMENNHWSLATQSQFYNNFFCVQIAILVGLFTFSFALSSN